MVVPRPGIRRGKRVPLYAIAGITRARESAPGSGDGRLNHVVIGMGEQAAAWYE